MVVSNALVTFSADGLVQKSNTKINDNCFSSLKQRHFFLLTIKSLLFGIDFNIPPYPNNGIVIYFS